MGAITIDKPTYAVGTRVYWFGTGPESETVIFTGIVVAHVSSLNFGGRCAQISNVASFTFDGRQSTMLLEQLPTYKAESGLYDNLKMLTSDMIHVMTDRIKTVSVHPALLRLNRKRKVLLWLDDMRNPLFDDWLNFSPIELPYQCVWVKTYDVFVKWVMRHGIPDAVSFDYNLCLQDVFVDLENEFGPSRTNTIKRKSSKPKQAAKTGADAAAWLAEYCSQYKADFPPYNIHSANSELRHKIAEAICAYFPDALPSSYALQEDSAQ